jgi:hypothetical protein
MRTDITIDLETLSTSNNPVILQLAAVAFNIETGVVYRKYNMYISLKSCLDVGLRIDANTLEWWTRQDNNLFQQVLSGKKQLKQTLNDFNKWLTSVTIENQSTKEQIHLWGNGILADNTWLKSAYEACDMIYPIHFLNDRDIRTLLEIAAKRADISTNDIRNKIPQQGEKHNALNDALYASKLISTCWSLISS